MHIITTWHMPTCAHLNAFSCSLKDNVYSFLHQTPVFWTVWVSFSPNIRPFHENSSCFICIINSCPVIGQGSILLQALPCSNSPPPLPALRRPSFPWNLPSLLLLCLLPPPTPPISEKDTDRPLCGFTSDTHNALWCCCYWIQSEVAVVCGGVPSPPCFHFSL